MISIIIAAYNEEKYIAESLESILNQDYQDIELIVVDDGSTDQTLSILKRYAAKDNRLKVFSPGKLGKNGAYNYAAQQVKGAWYMAFAADDILEPGILSEWMNAAKKYDPYTQKIVLLSRLKMFATDPKYKKYNDIEIPKNPSNVCMSGTAYLASRKVYENIYPIPNGFPNEDTWVALYFEFCLKKHEKIPILKTCTNYRIHDNNSLNKNAQYRDFNEKYHKRMLIIDAFTNQYQNQLNQEQLNLLAQRSKLETYRYNHKLCKIIFLSKVGSVEKLRNIFLCNAVLYNVKLMLNKFILGR